MEQNDFNFTDSTISLFRSINDKKPTETTIATALMGDTYKSEVEAVRNAKSDAARKKYKEALPAVTISAIMQDGHATENIKARTDIICMDFDQKDNAHLEDFDKLKDLVKSVPFVGYCARSCGGNGFFALIPIAAPYRFSEQYTAAVEYFKAMGIVADTKCKDITRLRFVTYDPEPYVNEHPKAFKFVIVDIENRQEVRRIAEKGVLSGMERKRAIRLATDYLEAAEAIRSDIADDYGTAQRMAFAFATSFGDSETGRKLYDKYCSLSKEKYTAEWAESKYDEALRHGRKEVCVASFFELCKDNGITIAADFNGIDLNKQDYEDNI